MGADSGLGPVVEVVDLLAPERRALLDLLDGLADDAWRAPTPCPAWSVHQLAVHLVHDDLRRLSGDRDGHAGAWIDATTLDELVVGLDKLNEQWVATMAPTLSPRLTRELLTWLAPATEEHLRSLDPAALDTTVAWAGPGPHPNWLDVAREYTERWVHQQQIRRAVGRPGLTDERFAAPVVETFARALPAGLPSRPDGTTVSVVATGDYERRWHLEARDGGWRFVTPARQPATIVTLPAEVLWLRAVRMLDREGVRATADVRGDDEVAAAILDLRSAIVRDDAHPQP